MWDLPLRASSSLQHGTFIVSPILSDHRWPSVDAYHAFPSVIGLGRGRSYTLKRSAFVRSLFVRGSSCPLITVAALLAAQEPRIVRGVHSASVCGWAPRAASATRAALDARQTLPSAPQHTQRPELHSVGWMDAEEVFGAWAAEGCSASWHSLNRSAASGPSIRRCDRRPEASGPSIRRCDRRPERTQRIVTMARLMRASLFALTVTTARSSVRAQGRLSEEILRRKTRRISRRKRNADLPVRL